LYHNLSEEDAGILGMVTKCLWRGKLSSADMTEVAEANVCVVDESGSMGVSD